MGGAQIGLGPARLDDAFGPLFDPCVKTRVQAHFGVELQRQDVAPAPERLMIIDMAGGQHLYAFGASERVTVPVEDGDALDMAQRAVLGVDVDGVKAHLLARAGIDLCAKGRRHHLRPETDAQCGSIRLQPHGKTAHLAPDPRMLILFIDAHRAAHHDQQIGFAQVQRGEGGIGHINAVHFISRRLDRGSVSRHALIGDVADDQGFLHRTLTVRAGSPAPRDSARRCHS
jgi:hypothetical protein